MSRHSQSSPVWAMVSAEMVLGMARKPPTAGLPSFQSCLRRFMRMVRCLPFSSVYRIGQAGGGQAMGMRTGWLAALLLCAAAAHAQNYPNQPIKLIVPWPPGGGVDTSARIIAQPLSERLGQSIVIDNRPGAGGNIGTEIAARSKPDGYTLVMASSSPNAINIHIYPKLAFEPLKDFAAIGYVTAVPNILVVPGGSPFNSAQELLAHIKANPGKVNYGSAGVGSSQHLAASMLIASTGANIVHVPYKGTSPAETDL